MSNCWVEFGWVEWVEVDLFVVVLVVCGFFDIYFVGVG